MKKSILLVVISLLACLMASAQDSFAEQLSGKAKEYYVLAQRGDAEAQYQLASCLHHGYGVEENDSLAFVWAKKSAEQNHSAGLYYLAYCYETGLGCRADAEMANTLYQQAYQKALPRAKTGDASAQFVVGKIFDYGSGGVPKNQEEAVRWYRQAAEQGYPGAQFNMGSCCQLGEGVKEDKSQAVYWYRQAALQGDADSQYMLGLCYAKGEGVSQNAAKALQWFKKSSRQGHRLAQHILTQIAVPW